jgi:hypothetical protein
LLFLSPFYLSSLSLTFPLPSHFLSRNISWYTASFAVLFLGLATP